MSMANSNSEKELFLDILTKEEREALLSRKMEEIRKKNELLRRRHQEVEADKKKAESKKTSTPENHVSHSPRNESNPFPSEERRKTSGRGKQLAKMSQEKLKAQDINIVVVNEKSSNKQSKRDTRSATMIKERPGQFHDSERETAMMSHERPHHNHDMRERGAPYKERQPNNHDYQREKAKPTRERSARYHDYDRERPKKSPHDRNRHSRDFDQKDSIGGPPPDPSYNFLADRRREGPGGGRGDNDYKERERSRRHPKNFGGTDFDNVKDKIKHEKNRQFDRHAPPKSKMDMAMSMTGKERRQYTEWRSEREKVDRDRIERQKSSSGEWRRAWDADKVHQEYDEPSGPQRMEPAKRPAGRIGSGRFAHGERDERQRFETNGPKAGRGQGLVQQQELPIQVQAPQQLQHAQPSKRPAGRGRGRGRGKSAGEKEQKPLRIRSFSDETRTVERQKDLLVIKVDNSPGQNGSVEVEYSDDNDTLTRKRRSPKQTVTSAVQTPPGECWEDEIHVTEEDKHANGEHKRKDDDVLKQHDEQEHDKRSHSTSFGDHDDSWEDCTEDSSDFYGTTTGESEDGLPIEHGDSMDKKPSLVKDISTEANAEKYREALKVDCSLNPDAPEFTPLSPEMMKTPPGHVKVETWSTVAKSPTSPVISPTYQVNMKKDLKSNNSSRHLKDVVEESIPDIVVNNNSPGSSGDGVPTGAENSLDGGVNIVSSSQKSRAEDTNRQCSTDIDDDENVNSSDIEETVEVQQIPSSQSSAVEVCAPEYSQNCTEELEDSDSDLEEHEGIYDERERSQERQMVSYSDDLSDDVTVQSSERVDESNEIESDNDKSDNDMSTMQQSDISKKTLEDASDNQREESGDSREINSKTTVNEDDIQSSELNQACTHSDSESKDVAETSISECNSEVVSES